MNVITERRGRPARSAWDVARGWLDEHGQVAIATVVSTWGSAPVPPGGQLVVAPGDRFEGSVSGGCVEVDVLVEAADVMATGKPRLVEYGVDEETAWRAGLPCGGKLKVLIEPLTRADTPLIDGIIAARRDRRSVVVTTRLANGARALYAPDDALADPILMRLSEDGERTQDHPSPQAGPTYTVRLRALEQKS